MRSEKYSRSIILSIMPKCKQRALGPFPQLLEAWAQIALLKDWMVATRIGLRRHCTCSVGCHIACNGHNEIFGDSRVFCSQRMPKAVLSWAVTASFPALPWCSGTLRVFSAVLQGAGQWHKAWSLHGSWQTPWWLWSPSQKTHLVAWIRRLTTH